MSCDIPKAVAEEAGYSLGALQNLIAASRDEVSIACYGVRGSAYKGWAKEILV